MPKPRACGIIVYRCCTSTIGQANSLAELEGKTFAFTDPDSNTGTLVFRPWPKLWDIRRKLFSKRRFTATQIQALSDLGVLDKAETDQWITESIGGSNHAQDIDFGRRRRRNDRCQHAPAEAFRVPVANHHHRSG